MIHLSSWIADVRVQLETVVPPVLERRLLVYITIAFSNGKMRCLFSRKNLEKKGERKLYLHICIGIIYLKSRRHD